MYFKAYRILKGLLYPQLIIQQGLIMFLNKNIYVNFKQSHSYF